MSLTLTRRHNVDRFGYLIPHRYGNLPVLGAVATFRPGEGKFGRGAVAVEEGTENLLSGRWAKGKAIEIEPEEGFSIAAKFVIDVDSPSNYQYTNLDVSIPCQPNTFYTLSYYARVVRGKAALTTGTQVYIGSDTQGTFGVANQQIYNDLDYEWKRFVVTGSTDADATMITRAAFRLQSTQSEVVEVEIADWQLEAKPFATSFVDGTRAAGRLSYPKSLIAGLNALTVAAWTSGPSYWASGLRYLVAAQTTGESPYGDLFVLRQSGGNGIRLWVRNDANSLEESAVYDNMWDGNWHLIVGVINKSPQPGRQPIELYVDGQLVDSSSNINAVPDLSNIDEALGVQVGNWRGSMQWNGLIDELLFLPYAASEEEIVSWYEAQGPLPPHPQALLQWDWQAVRPASMVKL